MESFEILRLQDSIFVICSLSRFLDELLSWLKKEPEREGRLEEVKLLQGRAAGSAGIK